MTIELIRIGAVFSILVIASYFDIFNNKDIPDWIYKIGIGIGAVLLAIDNPWSWVAVGASVAISVIIGMGLYIIGAWGGADAKITWAVAVLHPIWSSPFPFEKAVMHPLTAIGMLGNAAILTTFVYLPVVLWRKTTNFKIAFLPMMLGGYVILMLKGDFLIWIKNYIFMVL